MGATYDEVCADYMKTYENYYKVEKGSDKYNAILSSNIVKTLQAAFESRISAKPTSHRKLKAT